MLSHVVNEYFSLIKYSVSQGERNSANDCWAEIFYLFLCLLVEEENWYREGQNQVDHEYNLAEDFPWDSDQEGSELIKRFVSLRSVVEEGSKHQQNVERIYKNQILVFHD